MTTTRPDWLFQRDLTDLDISYTVDSNRRRDFAIYRSFPDKTKFTRYFSLKTGEPFPGPAKNHHLL